MTAMVLIDGWPDGYIEERAWVEVTALTDDRRKAIEVLGKEMPIDDMFPDEPEGKIHYTVTGQEWQRRVGHALPGDDEIRSERPLETYGDCPTCKGRKTYEVIEKIEIKSVSINADPATRLAGPPNLEHLVGLPVTERNEKRIYGVGGVITARRDERCEDCYGTGKGADWITGDEGWPYEKCEEGDDDAALFWTIGVSDEPDPSVNVSDDQGTLPTL